MANRHGAAGIDGELLHEAEADDVLPQVGVDDDAKGVEDGGLVWTGAHFPSLPTGPRG